MWRPVLLLFFISTKHAGPQNTNFPIESILQVLFGQGSPEKQVLEDFPDCGELGEDPTLRNNAFTRKQDNSCLRNCNWRRNVYFKAYFPWFLHSNGTEANGDKCKIVTQVRVLITAARVPTDLLCLRNCFPINTNRRRKYSEKRNLGSCAKNTTTWFPESLSDKIDYLMDKSTALRSKTTNEAILGNDFSTAWGQGDDDATGRDNSNNYSRFLRATNPFELSLEICAFARFLNDLNFNFGEGEVPYNLFGDKTCEDFLPTPKLKSRKTEKVFGPTTARSIVKQFPWLCSLKEAGFRGRHRCGVTLLSGPPNPILVSSAHCNYVCKDKQTMQIEEICCCRDKSEESSCREDSSYCTTNAELTAALPTELQIVCGEHSLALEPESNSVEHEVVLEILAIVIHKDYSPGKAGEPAEKRKGPYNGSDIAVYKVNSSKLMEKGSSRLKRKELYPACLPKKTYGTSPRGIFAAWNDPEPIYRVSDRKRIRQYTENYLYPKQVEVKSTECEDPSWMKSSTYYPAGTVCYRDPSFGSCVQFGNSGAGVIRKVDKKEGTDRYSWIGPLSMSKGCDLSWIIDNTITYASENPSVFTDAFCYLDWIAEQYGMVMPDSYEKPPSCKLSKGLIDDIEKSVCRANGHKFGNNTAHSSFDEETFCDFNQTDDEGNRFDKCRLLGQEGFAYNLFQCKDKHKQNVLCANNCRGVDPNAVIVGGRAVLAAAATGGLAYFGLPTSFWIPAAFGFGGISLAGGITVANGLCPVGTCNVRGRCCMLQIIRSRLRCPSRC